MHDLKCVTMQGLERVGVHLNNCLEYWNVINLKVLYEKLYNLENGLNLNIA